MFFVYVLRSRASGRLYTGYSSDVEHRLGQHNRGTTRSTKHDTSWNCGSPASTDLIEDLVPNAQSFEKLGTPLALRFIPLRSHLPCLFELLGQFAETFVITRPTQWNGTQGCAEIVREDHAITLDIKVLPQVVRVAFLPHQRVAEGDHITNVLSDAGDDVAGPDVVVSPNVRT